MYSFRLISFLCAFRFKVTATYRQKTLTMGLFSVKKGQGACSIGGICGISTLMRQVTLPPGLKGEILYGALKFKAEEELPYNSEEALLVMPGVPPGLFFSVKQDDMPKESYDVVTPVPLALMHFTSYFELPPTYLLIHNNEEEIIFLYTQEGHPFFLTSVRKKGDYKKEVTRRFKAHIWKPETPALILGEALEAQELALIPLVKIYLKECFGMSREELHKKAILVGLCRVAFDLPLEKFDLSSKKIAYKKLPWVKSFIITIISFLFIFNTGQWWLKKKEVALQNRFNSSDLEEYIKEMKKKTGALNYIYPLKPVAPAFSDFLAWVNSQAPPGVQIEKVHYSLISLPTLKTPKDHYVSQVELIFTADSAADARLFHDRLVAPGPFVITPAHFVWQSSEKDYRTSFRLKDRTVYELL